MNEQVEGNSLIQRRLTSLAGLNRRAEALLQELSHTHTNCGPVVSTEKQAGNVLLGHGRRGGDHVWRKQHADGGWVRAEAAA